MSIAPIPVAVMLNRPDVPCQYRLMNIHTKKFIGPSLRDGGPNMVDDWRDALFFSTFNHEDGNEEQELKFQWEWTRDEDGEEWMHDANMYDYQVHVVVGESD